jgi:membrane-bound metal-dependent hydrolase YbcI (DUF457 family)
MEFLRTGLRRENRFNFTECNNSMDILTHAGIGLIGASPVLATRPGLAVSFVAGSVLPDLDALCRLVDRQAFMRTHQTWSHALPVQAAVSAVAGMAAAWSGLNGIELCGGLLAGMLIHSFLDITNTFGVAWLTPFSRRRVCVEWVFFIDAVVLTAIAVTLAGVIPLWLHGEDVPAWYAGSFFAFLVAYVLGKGALRHRTGSFCPESKSLVPSALVPWRFYGTRRDGDEILLFRVNAFKGARSPADRVRLLDDSFAVALETLPEFRLMRGVSTEYHVISSSVEGSGTRLLCRDMRMRNLGTRFGDLEVWLDANRQVIQRRFYV